MARFFKGSWERMRELYRAREKARMDMISKLRYTENKGIEKGIETTAINLSRLGFPVEQVAEATQLTRERINELREGLKTTLP